MLTGADDLVAKLSNNEKIVTFRFREDSKNFIEKLTGKWSNLLNLQYQELSLILEQLDSSDAEKPNPSDAEIKFCLFLEEDSKLHCSDANCKSRFGHKRSYEFHMRTRHKTMPVDHSKKDPAGLCRLISTKRKGPCNTRLPLRSMYDHMEKIHQISRPGKDILMGFDMTFKEPVPIFCKKGGDLDKKYLRALKTNTKEEVGDKIETEEEDNGSLKKSQNVESKTTKKNTLLSSKESLNDLAKSTNVQRKFCTPVDKLPPADAISSDTSASEEDIPSSPVSNESNASQDQELDYETSQSEDSEEFTFKVPEVPPKKRKTSKSLKSFVSDISMPSTSSGLDGQHCIPAVKIAFSCSSPSGELEKHNYSDHEDGDSLEFTTRRRQNKQNRYLQRDVNTIELHDMEQNKKFIQDLRSYMEKNAMSTSKSNNRTMTKTIRHLFTKPDSLLSYEYKKDNSFTLEKLRNFKHPAFQHVSYPLDWILSTPDIEDSTLGVERLKGSFQKSKTESNILDSPVPPPPSASQIYDS